METIQQGILTLIKSAVLGEKLPLPETFSLEEADGLIRMEQYEKIIPIIENLGFAQGEETDHELHWSSKGLFVELHKWLIPSCPTMVTAGHCPCRSWGRTHPASGRMHFRSGCGHGTKGAGTAESPARQNLHRGYPQTRGGGSMRLPS